MDRLFLLEDDRSLIDGLRYSLEKNGFRLTVARTVGEAGLPVGVLGGVSGQSKMVRLAAGDLAVLVSDGLLVDGPGWVLKQLELSAAGTDSPERIAQELVETARARASQSGRPDDITAAVLRLERC